MKQGLKNENHNTDNQTSEKKTQPCFFPPSNSGQLHSCLCLCPGTLKVKVTEPGLLLDWRNVAKIQQFYGKQEADPFPEINDNGHLNQLSVQQAGQSGEGPSSNITKLALDKCVVPFAVLMLVQPICSAPWRILCRA